MSFSQPSTPGYQPTSSIDIVSDNLNSITATLDTMSTMLNDLPVNTEFEKGVVAYLKLLHSQVVEARVEQGRLRNEQITLRQDQNRMRDEFLVRNRNLRESVDELSLNVVKTEQYSRRDTVTIVGLPLPTTPEPQAELNKKVADVLSASGQTVAVTDLTACHRNSQTNRTVGSKTVPPSITVRFSKIDKKDAVLRGYKNFDSALKKPRDVKVYQSLTPHYATLRKTMFEFFNSQPSSREFGNVFNAGLRVKWITYQSPTSGFAFKLQSGEFFKGIHLFVDFLKLISDKFPACRAV
ncbi:MAG: hypothetical protein GY774_35355 [Planctomycetes bacterium]|nr:hypothetical protein [Planctomycetota bacterium]